MKPKAILSEDYTGVLLAFFIITIVLFGFKPTLPSFAWNTPEELLSLISTSQLWINLLTLWIFGSIVVCISFLLLGFSIDASTVAGYSCIFLIAIISQLITGNAFVKNLGLEIVLFSLLIGLFISNVLSAPDWLKPVIQTELYIKIGLVLLGCGIIFKDILQAGALGLVQSVAVVFVVWQFSFWLCKKFKLEDELRAMLSSAVAICGVSAAIATAGAIKGDSKKLSYVISLVLITAIPMMLFMPWIAKAAGLSDAVAGAWLGGTIDTTGAVVAAGKVLGDEALKYATVVKFSQNVLLGLAAFAISIYWAYTKNEQQERPSIGTIWERFPKFVLGFIAASLFFSFVLTPEKVADVKSPIKELQTLWFALAFVCIGLETKFVDIFKLDNGRPAYAFLIAQVFNILFTLAVALLVFG
jgi:uncharacterized integral membrane protein (TIGR00698 family)